MAKRKVMEKKRLRLNTDERTVDVRQASGADAGLFLQYFAGLSPNSRDSMRGWSRETSCTPEHAESLAARTDDEDHFAVVVRHAGQRTSLMC